MQTRWARDKQNEFICSSKEFCAPGTQTHNADIDNRSCQEIRKFFCAGKIYPNTLHLDKTRLQWN